MITRRSFLQAAALTTGGAALSPVAQALGRTIRAGENGARPLRFVFFLQGNGMEPGHIQPEGIALAGEPGALEERVLAGHALPRSLEPLQPFADRMTMIHGLSGRVTGPPAHSANFGALGCFPQRQGVFGLCTDRHADVAAAVDLAGVLIVLDLRQVIIDAPDHLVPHEACADPQRDIDRLPQIRQRDSDHQDEKNAHVAQPVEGDAPELLAQVPCQQRGKGPAQRGAEGC